MNDTKYFVRLANTGSDKTYCDYLYKIEDNKVWFREPDDNYWYSSSDYSLKNGELTWVRNGVIHKPKISYISEEEAFTWIIENEQ